MSGPDSYELYYWPNIPGRGEFVRLVLEEARAPYRDVGRLPAEGPERVAEFSGELVHVVGLVESQEPTDSRRWCLSATCQDFGGVRRLLPSLR